MRYKKSEIEDRFRSLLELEDVNDELPIGLMDLFVESAGMAARDGTRLPTTEFLVSLIHIHRMQTQLALLATAEPAPKKAPRKKRAKRKATPKSIPPNPAQQE